MNKEIAMLKKCKVISSADADSNAVDMSTSGDSDTNSNEFTNERN